MAVDPVVQDQVAIALSRLATQFRESPNLKGYISALLVEANTLEDVLWQLIEDRYIDTAYGVQLDILGEIVGQPRELIDAGLVLYFGFDGDPQANPFGSWQAGLVSGGRFAFFGEETLGKRELTDEEYRSFIKMKVINNITRSTPEEVISTFTFLFGADTPIKLEEGPGTEYSVEVGRSLTPDEKVLLANFPIPKTAGVKVTYTSIDGPPPGPEAPNITSIPDDISFLEDASGMLDLTDYNSGGPVDTWSIVGNPAWLTLDTVTGVLSWTSAPVSSGSFTVTATNVAGFSQNTTNYVVEGSSGGDFVADFALDYPNGTDLNTAPWVTNSSVPMRTSGGAASTNTDDGSTHASMIIAPFPEAVIAVGEVIGMSAFAGDAALQISIHAELGVHNGAGIRVYRWRTEFYENNSYRGEVSRDASTITSVGISSTAAGEYTFYIDGEVVGTRTFATLTGRQAQITGQRLKDTPGTGITKLTVGTFTI